MTEIRKRAFWPKNRIWGRNSKFCPQDLVRAITIACGSGAPALFQVQSSEISANNQTHQHCALYVYRRYRRRPTALSNLILKNLKNVKNNKNQKFKILPRQDHFRAIHDATCQISCCSDFKVRRLAHADTHTHTHTDRQCLLYV